MQKKTPKQAHPVIDAIALENKAQAAQQSGQYQEAIELYKTLLKQGKNQQWQQALTQCSLQRVRELAGKHRIKDAVTAWENYAQSTQPPFEDHDWYIASLLQLNHPKLKTSLKQLTAQQLDVDFPELSRLLGFVILAQQPALALHLPNDSVFVGHLQSAQQALEAFQNNTLEPLEAALQQLPFRSAFKDFRTLIKANLALSETSAKALDLLKKIPENSPYFHVSRLLEVCMQQGKALAQAASSCTNQQRQFIGATKKLNKKQTELLDTLCRHTSPLSDKFKFNVALHYSALWGEALAQAYCQSALVNYPAGQRDYQKHFAAPAEFERLRRLALQCEHDEDLYSGEYYWQQAINILKNQGAEGAYKIALIMRHIAGHQATEKNTVEWLTQSLEYDPDDQDSYIKIIQFYDQQRQTDACQEWLEKALEQCPNQVELLNLAIKTASRLQAFTKATQYAEQLLKLDPVNSFAKQTLFNCHLTQARWLIKAKKFHWVETELKQAQALTVSKRYQNQAGLLHGFYMFAAQDKAQGSQLIALAAQESTIGLFNAHFLAALEAHLLELPVRQCLSQLPPLPENHLLDAEALNGLIQLINGFYEEDNDKKTVLGQVLMEWDTLIERSLKQTHIDKDTLLKFCQCLEKIDSFPLMTACVNAAGLMSQPIWTYYQIYAQHRGKPETLTGMNRYRLETSLQDARQGKDQRAQVLIETFLKRHEQHKKSSRLDFLEPSGYDEDHEIDNPFDALFAHLPNVVYNQLGEEVVRITKKTSPDKSFKMLTREYLGNDPALLQAIMENFDAFYALMMLKAADNLKIDISLTADDIIKHL